MSFAISDAIGHVLHSALGGVTSRQNVIADNIANVDTPGFRARAVEFETHLRSAIHDGSFDGRAPVNLPLTATPTATPVGPNGNNVDLRKETMAAMQTQFQYQIITRSVTDRYDVLRTAIQG